MILTRRWKKTDEDPISRSHVREALGCNELLQVDGSTSHEAKRWVHDTGTVHLTLVKASHGVGVVEEDTSGVVVQTDSDSLRKGEDAAAGLAHAGGSGSFRDKEFAHAQGQQGEGLREFVAGIFTATVVSTVVVEPGI